jgi:hypothetical protein
MCGLAVETTTNTFEKMGGGEDVPKDAPFTVAFELDAWSFEKSE